VRTRALFSSSLFALVLALLPGAALGQVCTDLNGTFRFVNNDFPSLSTNGPVFNGQLMVVNADGTVTFSVDPTSPDPLPDGLTLDSQSGLITGIPEHAGNEDVKFRADDGTQFVTRLVNFSISSSGGGGNGGSGLVNNVFPDGTVGTAYTFTPTPEGDGPFIWGGVDLPPGLSLNGATGELSGTPTAAGTFYMTITVNDQSPGEQNIGATIVPIRILPAGSTFAFVTEFLNNGEVGTQFCDQYEVENAAGGVTFTATNLPDGLVLDSASGAVTGVPTVAGTFLVTITANDGTDTITTNLSMVIAPGPVSSFHWIYLGLPAALENTLYDRVPPIVLAAEGADGAITYAATGLPDGMTYNSSTGELSGTPEAKGEYPVTFTATDSGDDSVILLKLTFVVLPATGGDVADIIPNVWITRASVKLGEDGSESMKFSAIYNADRRTGVRFDPATDTFRARLGEHVLEVAPGGCVGSVPDQSCTFKSASGVIPAALVKVVADKQTAAWSTKNDTIAETVPNVLWSTLKIGDESYRVSLRFNDKGVFKPALGYERSAFVVSKGALAVGNPGSDSAKLSLLLADPSLSYQEGVSTLRVRILDGTNVLVDRDFTALGGPENESVDSATGRTVFSFKTLKDAATTDRVAMSFANKTGKMKLVLTATDLAGVPANEAHLGVEVTIGTQVYITHVTFFETSPGKYGLAIP
jgi:Putative Ig domain